MLTIEERKARVRAKFKDYKPKPIKPIKLRLKFQSSMVSKVYFKGS